MVGNSKGLAARYKYLFQSPAGLGAALALHQFHQSLGADVVSRGRSSRLVCSRDHLFVILTYFVIVGSSNAANLTDGLDGLAIMQAATVAGALGVFAYATGNVKFATYLQIPYIPGVGARSPSAARPWSARGSASCGSTPTRRRCSWVTWARSRSASSPAR